MEPLDPRALEILRMARELVINEHTDRRAEMHNQWLTESSELWRTRRIRLAYPPIPPYPTENDIIARARVLLEFVEKSPTVADTTVPVVENVPLVSEVKSVDILAVPPVANIEPDSSPESKQPVTPTPTVQELMDYMKEAKAAEPEPTGILPSLLKKIEEIRGNRNSNAE
jgi:hypothetical protein